MSNVAGFVKTFPFIRKNILLRVSYNLVRAFGLNYPEIPDSSAISSYNQYSSGLASARFKNNLKLKIANCGVLLLMFPTFMSGTSYSETQVRKSFKRFPLSTS